MSDSEFLDKMKVAEAEAEEVKTKRAARQARLAARKARAGANSARRGLSVMRKGMRMAHSANLDVKALSNLSADPCMEEVVEELLSTMSLKADACYQSKHPDLPALKRKVDPCIRHEVEEQKRYNCCLLPFSLTRMSPNLDPRASCLPEGMLVVSGARTLEQEKLCLQPVWRLSKGAWVMLKCLTPAQRKKAKTVCVNFDDEPFLFGSVSPGATTTYAEMHRLRKRMWALTMPAMPELAKCQIRDRLLTECRTVLAARKLHKTKEKREEAERQAHNKRVRIEMLQRRLKEQQKAMDGLGEDDCEDDILSQCSMIDKVL